MALSRILFGVVLASTVSFSAQADWRDWMQQLGKVLGENPQAVSALDQTEVVAGLREALRIGAHNAILQLGKPDGFLSNPQVKVPLPPTLASTEEQLRKLGMGSALDSFSLSLNRAAEQAVPEVADIFSQAIQNLTIQDAMEILNGPNDAATQYFRRSSEESLRQRIGPLVAQATDQVGVTQLYKSMSKQAGPLASMLLGPSGDLDGFVTDKSLDGLFHVIAGEEERIRSNPAARGSELLRKVFGAQ